MLGMFKRKPAEPFGPCEFEHSVEIERPAAEVYAMVDWGDERNAKRALGNKVEELAPGRFRLHLDMVPGHEFVMIVTEATPGRRYAYDAEITPPVGRLVDCRETYTVEPLGEASCKVSLRTTAWFVGGMSSDEMAMEIMMMGTAGQNSLCKLKIQAEQGVDAVHAIEAQQMDCFDDE